VLILTNPLSHPAAATGHLHNRTLLVTVAPLCCSLMHRYGMLYSTVLVKVLLAWVVQKALVVLNLLPARLLLVIIPINTVVLLLMIANSLGAGSAGNSNLVRVAHS